MTAVQPQVPLTHCVQVSCPVEIHGPQTLPLGTGRACECCKAEALRHCPSMLPLSAPGCMLAMTAVSSACVLWPTQKAVKVAYGLCCPRVSVKCTASTSHETVACFECEWQRSRYHQSHCSNPTWAHALEAVHSFERVSGAGTSRPS